MKQLTFSQKGGRQLHYYTIMITTLSTRLGCCLGLRGWISRGKSFPPGPCLAGRKYIQMLEAGIN